MTLTLNRVTMTMQGATITAWFKQVGDKFSKGDVLYSFETEKATQDVEALETGTMVEILVKPGEDVTVGDPICVIEI